MEHPQAVLFDFDGVLADTEPVHFACWREVLAGYGAHLSWDDYAAHCIGASERETVRILCELVRPAAAIAVDQLWAQYPRKQEMFRARALASPPAAGDIKALLEKLDGRYKLAVVSSSIRREIEPLLVAMGIHGFFQTLICAEDVANHKPAPDPYLEAARRLGVQRALVVEDSDAGVASGIAAGFPVLRVRHARDTAAEVERYLAQADGQGREPPAGAVAPARRPVPGEQKRQEE